MSQQEPLNFTYLMDMSNLIKQANEFSQNMNPNADTNTTLVTKSIEQQIADLRKKTEIFKRMYKTLIVIKKPNNSQKTRMKSIKNIYSATINKIRELSGNLKKGGAEPDGDVEEEESSDIESDIDKEGIQEDTNNSNDTDESIDNRPSKPIEPGEPYTILKTDYDKQNEKTGEIVEITETNKQKDYPP
jgi:hypothetical protein